MSMKNVLIVDDEKTLLLTIKAGFVAYQDTFTVFTAENGIAAIYILESTSIDLVVTDLKMPEMGGFELLVHIKAHYPSIPVVVMTAFGTPQIEVKLKKCGMLRLLEKPVDFDELTQVILKYLDEKYKGGTLTGISLPSFLQLIEMEQNTCLMEVSIPSGEQGLLYFHQGVLYDALFQELKGEEAVYAMLILDDVKISFRSLPDKRFRKNIKTNLMTLLMEGDRRREKLNQLHEEEIIPLEDKIILNRQSAGKTITEDIDENIGEPINQLIDDSNNEPINKFDNEPIDELDNVSVDQLNDKPVDELDNVPVDEFNDKPVDELDNKSVDEINLEPVEKNTNEPTGENIEEPVSEVDKKITPKNEDFVNVLKGEPSMTEMYEVLEKLKVVGGFLAVGAFSANGEMVAEVNAAGINLGELGAIANDVLLKAQKATEMMNVGRGQVVHVEAPKAHIIARCLNEATDFASTTTGRAHVHMVLILDREDGNIALGKMKMENIIHEIADFFR